MELWRTAVVVFFLAACTQVPKKPISHIGQLADSEKDRFIPFAREMVRR